MKNQEKMSMRNMNRGRWTEEVSSRRYAVGRSRKKFFISFIFLLLTVHCLLFTASYAAQEVLKTSKIKVGEKVTLTETLKRANEEGKVIALVLLSNPMQCDHCDSLISLLEKESEPYKKDVVFITAGGQDMLGAASEETIALKKLYGFVTVGEPWTFIIDKEGVLRKMFIGLLSQEELEGTLNSIIGGGKK